MEERECLIYRKGGPLIRWWPELEINGVTVHNMCLVGPEGQAEWFMLEFADGSFPFNSAAHRLAFPRICVREDWFADEDETLPDYIRRKAREWMGPQKARKRKKAAGHQPGERRAERKARPTC